MAFVCLLPTRMTACSRLGHWDRWAERPLCSGCGRSPAVSVLTLCAIERTFDSAACACLSDRYARYC